MRPFKLFNFTHKNRSDLEFRAGRQLCFNTFLLKQREREQKNISVKESDFILVPVSSLYKPKGVSCNVYKKLNHLLTRLFQNCTKQVFLSALLSIQLKSVRSKIILNPIDFHCMTKAFFIFFCIPQKTK